VAFCLHFPVPAAHVPRSLPIALPIEDFTIRAAEPIAQAFSPMGKPTPFTNSRGDRMATKKKKGAKKGARKGAKKASRKKAAKRGGAKRKPNAAFMRPMQPDAALSAVVGSSPIPRTEVTKKLWQYIKRNGLQDAKERRMINADDKLRVVFGGKGKVSMFEMTKLVSKHMK
jgi:upstream activation factor subunit UAF30